MRVMRDLPVVVWLVAAAVVAVIHRWVPEATWLMIHLVALGAMTHAVMVWSAHFTAALLKTRPDDGAATRSSVRLGLLGVSALLVLVGVPTTVWWLVLLGAVGVSAAVVWHGVELVRDLRRALPGRFRICIRYYVAAALCLPVGAGFGAALALGLDDDWHARLLVAHTMTNLLGWFGLTVVGTLVTFWPTVLRTRMDDRAERLAKQALPIFLAAIGVVVLGSLTGLRLVSVLGLLVYVGALVFWGRCLVGPLRRKLPREFAPASIGLACVWACVAIVATALHVLRTDDAGLAEGYPLVASIWVVGFLLQLVTGALSYLIPSVIGGGPRVVRKAAASFDRFAAARVVVINVGLVLWLFPLASWIRVTLSVLVLAALVAFLPLMFGGILASAREKRRAEAGEPADDAERPSAFTGTGFVAGVAALVLAITLGIGADPGAVGLGQAAAVSSDDVAATGQTVRVRVEARDMAFEPNSVTVNAGDHVIIELVNTDPTNLHDLAVGDKRTERLREGETAELDLGVVGGSLEGWCTVVGHRQMGMTFSVIVDGDAAAPAKPGSEPTAGVDYSQVNPDAELAHIVDPTLAPLTDETVHRLTFTVTEAPLEVAPGIWQTRWTYNGQGVGPTLHGRVGDVFEITLVNEGSMGHSIDFHASNLAPDGPMRTIAPGESLVYRFTAERSGVWMYHCSTMPMSSHIAAGMHGAVIIEPEEGLPEVDREYVVVQSEVYLDSVATSADAATEVDSDAVAAEDISKVVFNGVANQYDQAPFTATVGERVRFWVLDVGPNRASSFHIVGGQFDTVYKEGAYLLRDGVDAFGNTGGGAQALDLQAAQGGFVELTFPEAGHYPVVSHTMIDAERGAHGIVEVTG
ncbi:multicopper oxidase domain-containing protein [Tessaracoccus sp. OS52]|uniref:multicopper oxidase domain-containing protein n=1 Tax=Tessaracoccus sp. OS52 TaxID=2886691 RepID=UPI001D11901E|nr:multicopper oxidase domain-containing protein [Tessaracoccus sp. OS52]MCC2592044.1 multicopper oxidase domain-containing protein [Tessaracoccus sp. OS52]